MHLLYFLWRLHAAGGLFTSTNPETRRIRPDAVNGRVVVKVVYTVLEAQYQSAISQAVRNINSNNSQASVTGNHW
jgi:magnesium chelatase subunit H